MIERGPVEDLPTGATLHFGNLWSPLGVVQRVEDSTSPSGIPEKRVVLDDGEEFFLPGQEVPFSR